MRQKFDAFTLSRPKTRKAVGWFLIVLGILGIILPIVPGWITIFVGLEVLGIQLVFPNKLKLFFPRKSVSVTKSDK